MTSYPARALSSASSRPRRRSAPVMRMAFRFMSVFRIAFAHQELFARVREVQLRHAPGNGAQRPGVPGLVNFVKGAGRLETAVDHQGPDLLQTALPGEVDAFGIFRIRLEKEIERLVHGEAYVLLVDVRVPVPAHGR